MLRTSETSLKSVRPKRNLKRDGQSDRRTAIVSALRRLMIEKGYAETSLSDLAQAAAMSVSHLLYYFPSKEAVLEELCANVVDGMLAQITPHKNEPLEERIHILVDYLFMHAVVPRKELGFVLELIALSIHRPNIQKRFHEYNKVMMAYLEDVFEKAPRQPGLSARDAADIAGALWMGMVTMASTDPVGLINDSRARQLYRRSLLALANLPGASARTTFSPVRRASSR